MPIRSGESVHYLIIGIGVVSVPDPGGPEVRVDRLRALGLTLADHPGLRLSLGYTSGIVVAVPEDAGDVRVEVSQRPFGPLRVQANHDSYGSGLVCRRVLDQGLAAVAWLAAARGWRETRAFDESGRWHLKQNPESTLCGLQVDVDDTNPAQPDFGAFRHDLAGPVPAGSRHRVTARPGLRLRAGPSTGFDVIAILALGTEIDVLERAGEWAKVDLEGDGLADGFVHAGFLEPVG